jgi:hypothetical protein
MAMIKVQLTEFKTLEILGEPQLFSPGDVIEVGRQTAREWLASGQAVGADDPLPEKKEPRVNIAGRFTKL